MADGGPRRSSANSTRPEPTTDADARRLFGFDFIDDVDHAATIERILGPQPDDGLLPLVVTPNVDYIVRLEHPDLATVATAARRARYVLPDGQPIVWTSRLAGRPLRERLPGSLLFGPLWERVIAEQRRAVVVASTDEVADGLRAECPSVGAVVPPFFDDEDTARLDEVAAECVAEIRRSGAELVFVGVSFPKQMLIALRAIDRLRDDGEKPPLFLLLGGSFNMHLGHVRLAPRWIRRLGLEFLFRLALEPRRLFRRYLLADVQFLPIMLREVWTLRRGPGVGTP